MTLQEAKDYIKYGIKEGYFDSDLFCDENGEIVMKNEDLIKFAEEADARADWEFESKRDDNPF